MMYLIYLIYLIYEYMKWNGMEFKHRVEHDLLPVECIMMVFVGIGQVLRDQDCVVVTREGCVKL